MSPAIRLAAVSDADAVASLVRGYWDFENIAGYDLPRIITLLTDLMNQPHRGQCWVADEGGRLVGYLLAVYLFSLEHGGKMAEIDEFFVVPEKRSLNIGAGMLDFASRAMAQQGITRLQLQLGARNLQGKRFYERCGFRFLSGYDVLTKPLASSA